MKPSQIFVLSLFLIVLAVWGIVSVIEKMEVEHNQQISIGNEQFAQRIANIARASTSSRCGALVANVVAEYEHPMFYVRRPVFILAGREVTPENANSFFFEKQGDDRIAVVTYHLSLKEKRVVREILWQSQPDCPAVAITTK